VFDLLNTCILKKPSISQNKLILKTEQMIWDSSRFVSNIRTMLIPPLGDGHQAMATTHPKKKKNLSTQLGRGSEPCRFLFSFIFFFFFFFSFLSGI